jgi:hypothetical protein
MIENSVVSCPPCCVPLDEKAAPTLPFSAPRIHSDPAFVEAIVLAAIA